MNQEEITKELTYIIWAYCLDNNTHTAVVNGRIDARMNEEGIDKDLPMYATARLMVVRDLLRIWCP